MFWLVILLFLLPVIASDNSNDFIRKLCKNVDDSKYCYTLYSPYANFIRKHTAKFVEIGVSVTLTEAQDTLTHMKNMSLQMKNSRQADPKIDHRITHAFKACVRKFDDVLDNLKSSDKIMDNLGRGKTLKSQLPDVHVHMRAALKSEEDCLDEFKQVKDTLPTKLDMSSRILEVQNFTKYALAFVDNYKKTLK
ncbi:hypothetical protein FRX31_014130 [Thalictrum thalictroides]|uniref:Pectinesterase inhibitor domain-containing protein n=1 Tax=Thalictrum thalictroides TaxID=46969 RepID=A0A7J6WJJ1_THATH|nr:hypothetical protein FRX31_014130 [Thalictrum thalictroides]